VGEKQAEMIKEIVEVNQLPEEEVRELVKVYLYE
jgi:predicted HTH domain antitoxin